ncbi:unnamed protein product [Ceutorhynchus assimilis]|uniref:DNA 3'-5' helicase n=1 Tax=Ceutorhynchus assimilis TaxID=467358 RepID=A0A9N9QFX6_9CUCU|nr:unnamed protein product [Ceutorhynchus assimilis]
MSLLENPDTKKTYDKCKYIVNVWERSFTKKNNRIPSKLDIREAPIEVRHAYRRYFQIKTAALEETFMDVEGLEDDDNELSTTIIDPESNDDQQPTDPESNFQGHDDECASSIDVWGSHLNKRKSPTSVEKCLDKAPSEPVQTITKKLFQGFKSKKRNPRKSLSQKKSSEGSFVESPSFCSQTESTELEESAFLNSSSSEIKPSFSLSILDSSRVNKTRKIDSGWLERLTNSTGVTATNPELSTKINYSDDDSDEIIEGSDEESMTTSFHVAKKIKISEPTKTNDENSPNLPQIDLPIKEDKKQPKSKKKSQSKTSPPIRKSTRTTKNKVSLEELSDQEADPFASDTDDKDPEFVLQPKKTPTKFVFDSKEIVTSKIKKPTKEIQEKPTKETHENYELEYNVKPRISAPRYTNLKSIIKEKLLEQLPSEDEEIDAPKDKRQQAKEKLEKKVASGNLNDNFVTINIKKKTFVRGKKGRNFSKYKKSQFKSKQKTLHGPDMDMGGCDGGKLICFNCGQEGHFAQKCKATKQDNLLPLKNEEEEDCPFPTLEEATKMASDSVLNIRRPKLDNEEWLEDSDDDILMAEVEKLEEHVKKLDVQEYLDNVKVVRPYYQEHLTEAPKEVDDALLKFGHNEFRQGQEKAIMRILSGKSTLVTLSTGSGKSLCYQLPAYLYSQREPCISLVISPLVSLMEDQVVGIPKFLKAACLHTNQTENQRQKILEAISIGDLNVLLISPEAVVAGEKKTGFGSLFRKLPPIAFACIDEAHCVSQWSHNFRPSYLMICRVLKESLGVRTILGLTATATKATCQSIVTSLDIKDGIEGIISDVPLPDNLNLTVSKDGNRDRALLNLLLSERFKECKSIIVYCTRREECERVAAFLRTSLKSEKVLVESTNNKKRKRLNLQAEPYHAGLSASRRRTVQNAFMSGELRVVVATVAFGMGINKSDIRAVIHYNMPNSFESYVQEVGRAGRDGLPAHCHVFLDSRGRDENELRRHVHANSIDRHVIRKLLQKIFIPCSCKTKCPKHEVAFSIEQTIRALDVPEENISTLLCYLELHKNKYIELLNPAYIQCKVISYGGPLQIRKASKECPPLAMALALHPPKQNEENLLEFPVVDVASAMGWDSGICKHKLKNLEWTGLNKRSNLTVQFSNLGFRLLAPGNLTDDELDEALDNLCERVLSQETKALKQLHCVHKTLSEVAEKSYITCLQENTALKHKIREYFDSLDPLEDVTIGNLKNINEDQLCNDIRAMINMFRDNQFTGRALARIFHGIQSPNYPAVIWGRCKYWRSHLNEDFHEICRIATREIIKMR